MNEFSKPSMPSIEITSTPDIDAVAETLAVAFADDPITCWAIPSNTVDRDRYLLNFFRLTTQNLLNQGGLVAKSEGYEAVLTWLPPSRGVVPDEESRDRLDQLAESTGPCGSRVRTLMTELDRGHPADLPPHYAVVAAGIRLDSRGSGLQGAIIGTFASQLVSDGAGVYAEASSSRSLRLWERWGLRRVGAAITMPNGGPSLYPIYAEANEALNSSFFTDAAQTKL